MPCRISKPWMLASQFLHPKISKPQFLLLLRSDRAQSSPKIHNSAAMELELGFKITKTRDTDHTSADFRIAKDRAGPIFFSTETETMFILTAHLKGFRRQRIKIDINEDGTQISISGEKHVQEMVMMKWTMHNKPVEIKRFRKVFRIPDGVVDLDRIKARFNEEDTILSIFMPKSRKGILGIEIEQVKEEEIELVTEQSTSVPAAEEMELIVEEKTTTDQEELKETTTTEIRHEEIITPSTEEEEIEIQPEEEEEVVEPPPERVPDEEEDQCTRNDDVISEEITETVAEQGNDSSSSTTTTTSESVHPPLPPPPPPPPPPPEEEVVDEIIRKEEDEEEEEGNAAASDDDTDDGGGKGSGMFRFPTPRFMVGSAFIGLLIALIIQLLKKNKNSQRK